MISSCVIEPEWLALHPVVAMFCGGLELIGFRAFAGPDGIHLRWRWRSHHCVSDSLEAVFTCESTSLRVPLTPRANRTKLGDDLLMGVRLDGAMPAAIELNVEDTSGRILLPVYASSLPVTTDFTGLIIPFAEAHASQLPHSMPGQPCDSAG